jgi:hypothetical protein
MRKHAFLVSAVLAFAAPAAAPAMPSPDGAAGPTASSAAQRAATADTRVAIILQSKPIVRKAAPAPKKGK